MKIAAKLLTVATLLGAWSTLARANPESPAAPDAAAPVDPPAQDVSVRGKSREEQLRRSSQAVTVVELEEARRGSTDLGEIMARTQGVSVQRTGGLGSEQRFSLNGFEDDQIRFFLEGVPLELAGYPFGIADIPVNAIDHVEIYSGVVPIRFGADALGGAVQLVTRAPAPGIHGAASYQAGSFDTQRATLSASDRDEENGFLAQVSAFGDSTRNDYQVTVDVPDELGQVTPSRLHLFHNAYRAGGVNLNVGFIERPWADRLTLGVFSTGYRRELQNDPSMNEPYGEPVQTELVSGGVLTYSRRFDRAFKLELNGGYNFDYRHQADDSDCIYDWFGRCVNMRVRRGEITSSTGPSARDAVYDTHSAFLRSHASFQIDEQQSVGLSIAPTFATRTGDERKPLNANTVDQLNSDRDLITFVAGVDHDLKLIDDRLQTNVFAKAYVQAANSEEILRSGEHLNRDRDTQRLGAGASARYAFVEQLWAKVSYEYATRLPTIDEIYGSGSVIDPNLGLAPEVSHNANLTLATQVEHAPSGVYRMEATGFCRDADQLITLLTGALTQRYMNVASARSVGLQLAGGWTSPRRYLALDGNTTYQDFRNTSKGGPFASYNGDRITNRPYLFATGQARLQFENVAVMQDRVWLAWTTRYTHAFNRTWESIGNAGSRPMIGKQVVHALGVGYLIEADDLQSVSLSLDFQNITDARVLDAYGVERPGRAMYFKTTLEM